jgi:hypothetical protein
MLPYSARSFSKSLDSQSEPCLSKCRTAWAGRARRRFAAGAVVMILTWLALTPASLIYAASFPGSAGIPVPPSSQETFEKWLGDVGRPISSRYHAYKASFATFRDYRLLVYGTPADVPGNRYDSATRQYACLGFSYEELVVTNSLFPDDAPGGVTQSTPWQWQELPMGQSALISWARLSSREKQFIKQSILTYRNDSYGGMTFSNLGLDENNTVVLAPPSWHLNFALYTTHYRPGSSTDLRYATFNGQGAGSVTLSGAITVLTPAAEDGKYQISMFADHLDLEYQISGQISGFQGLALDQDIKYRGAGNSSAWTSGSGAGPWSVRQNMQINRSDLAGLSEKQYKLAGQAWAVSQMGDIELLPLEKLITVKTTVVLPFTVKADVAGYIHYFSGQTNSQGVVLPVQRHRFLALERIKLTMRFTREPLRIEYQFLGNTGKMDGIAGQIYYETSLNIPVASSTLSWQDVRLKPSQTLVIKAWDRSTPAKYAECRIDDIELTGSVYDISYLQPR